MDLRTLHSGGFARGRRRARPAGVGARTATDGRSADVAAVLTGSSMRVMEASLAVIAIATAFLLGLGR